jgi:hypothetical protein
MCLLRSNKSTRIAPKRRARLEFGWLSIAGPEWVARTRRIHTPTRNIVSTSSLYIKCALCIACKICAQQSHAFSGLNPLLLTPYRSYCFHQMSVKHAHARTCLLLGPVAAARVMKATGQNGSTCCCSKKHQVYDQVHDCMQSYIKELIMCHKRPTG